MDKKQILKLLKKKGPLSMEGMITELAGALPCFAGKQYRYGVSTYPGERALRYYMNEGLMDRPVKYRGAAGVFSYRHVLQVLTVKYLQAQYFPLNKIKDMLSGLSEKEMENFLLEDDKTEMKTFFNQAVMFYPRRISGRRNRFFDAYEPEIPEDNIFRCFKRAPGDMQKIPEEWLRVPVTDGVELNIRTNSLPAGEKQKKEFIEKLSARLRMLIENEKPRGGP